MKGGRRRVSERANEGRARRRRLFPRGQIDDGGGGEGKAHVGARGGHVLVVFARVGRLGALFADDAELLRRQHGLPLVLALPDRVVRHVFRLAAAEEGAQEGDGGHGTEEGGGGVGAAGQGEEGCSVEGCCCCCWVAEGGRGDVCEGECADEVREGWEAHQVLYMRGEKGCEEDRR